MRQLSLVLLFVSASAGSIFAQSTGIGNNSVMISTTTEGNVAWSANIDGHSRKGYIDNNSLEVCNHKVDENVIVPTATDTYPSLATDVLFFNGDGVNTYTVTIKDPNGNVVVTKQSKEDESLDISAYDDGTYTLLIKRGEKGKEYIRKIVKE